MDIAQPEARPRIAFGRLPDQRIGAALILKVYPFFVEAARITVQLSVLMLALGLVCGALGAAARLSRLGPLRFLGAAYVSVIRGTPALIQLYFGGPQIGIDLPAFVAGVIGLRLHFAVYNSELIQTAILAVDTGQMEAARTLGLSRGQALRKVVIPQAVRDVTPPIGNNMIALSKDSALVSVIGVSALTLSAQLAIGRTYRPFEFYLVAAVLYYIVNLGMEAVLRRIERRTGLSR